MTSVTQEVVKEGSGAKVSGIQQTQTKHSSGPDKTSLSCTYVQHSCKLQPASLKGNFNMVLINMVVC